MKFSNIIDSDPESKERTYKMKIEYLTQKDERYRYYFRARQGGEQPQVSFDRVTKHLFF
jgi:hypothetical protein